jgi:hypothetical protein
VAAILASFYKSIDVRRWHREGRLLAGRQFSWSWSCDGEPSGAIKVGTEVDAVVLIYRVRSFLAGWKSIEQRIPITWTPCHLGGRRPWFICSIRPNGRYCGRRVAVLYLAGESFACRKCYGLAYASQQGGLLFRNLPAHIRDRLFDHVPDRGAGARYDHHEYAAEMRAAVERWADYVAALVRPEGVALLR